VIDTERGKALSKEYNIKFMETSAKNSINVEEAFLTLARDIKKRLIDNAEQPLVENTGGLKLKDNQNTKDKPSSSNGKDKEKKKCCGT